jgi:hypothetical protein
MKQPALVDLRSTHLPPISGISVVLRMGHNLPWHDLVLLLPAEHPIVTTNGNSDYSAVKGEMGTSQMLEMLSFSQISADDPGPENNVFG